MRERPRPIYSLGELEKINLLADRFWKHVAISNGCWLWTGPKDTRGYGQIWVRRIGSIRATTLKAHKTAWMILRGSIPDGLCVLHNCPTGDNPTCVNPAHLWLGTHQDNMADRNAKGRQARGERHGSRTMPERIPRGEQHWAHNHPEEFAHGEDVPHHIFTEGKVRLIRELAGQRALSERRLAAHLGISRATVRAVRDRRKWKHVT